MPPSMRSQTAKAKKMTHKNTVDAGKRERALELVKIDTKSLRCIEKETGVPRSTVNRIRKAWKRTELKNFIYS